MEDQRYSQERKEGLAMDAVAAPMPENSMMDTSKSEQSEQSESSTAGHLTGFTLGITLLALCIATFCVALDNTIISTAIPAITDEFHALQDVGWYGSGESRPSAITVCKKLSLANNKLVSIPSHHMW